MIEGKIEIVCQNCYEHYFVPSSRARWIRDHIIDASVCPFCGTARVSTLEIFVFTSKKNRCRFVIEGIQCNAEIKGSKTYCHTHYMQIWRKRKSQEK